MAALRTDLLDTLILDLGGVLIDVHYDRSAKAFEEAGVKDFNGLFSKARQTPLFDRFEIGAITPAAFREELRQLAGLPLKDRVINDSWNAMLGTIPPERMALVEELRQ